MTGLVILTHNGLATALKASVEMIVGEVELATLVEVAPGDQADAIMNRVVEAVQSVSADGAIILVDSVAGMEVGTEVAWRYADEFNLPRFVVVNKLDRENANFAKAVSTVESFSSTRLVKLQIPIGEKHDFKGVVDLVSMKAFMGDGKTVADVPAEFKAAAEEARNQLIEAAAEGEDVLLEKYLESGELTQEELLRGLRNIVRNGIYIPVLCAAGGHEVGIAPLLNSIVELMPSPADRPVVTVQGKSGDEPLPVSDTGPVALYVWKTNADPFVGKMTYFRVRSGTISSDVHLMNIGKNADERMAGLHIQRGKESIPVKVAHAGDLAVVAKLSVTATCDTLAEKTHPVTLPVPKYPTALFQVAIHPKTQADAAKISPTLTRLCEEDMTLSWHNERTTGQTILQGMGDQHIDVVIHRAQTKFQVGLVTDEPKVPYREGIT
ncbi:MAG: elongation factor G, partial [Anaerolineaceae bacterium]|nr:elongation factor G [Anaerolineaceae bacterium]